MKKLAAILAAFVIVAPVYAQQPPAPVTATPTPSNATATPVIGSSGSGVADDGSNPVKTGAVFETTPTTILNGQRSTLHTTSAGALLVAPSNLLGTAFASVASPADGQVNNIGLMTNTETMLYNGSTWDRAFACPNTAVVNVTAAATTEIVALTASQIIRVCSLALTMSVAGTAQIVNGTGSNCGTGTANITGAMNLGAATPLAMGSGIGSILRAPVSNALCISAVTGNVTGFITYAKY